MDRTISYSEVATWLACKQKWAYAYLESLEPKEEAGPLALGTLVHACLAAGLAAHAAGRGESGAAPAMAEARRAWAEEQQAKSGFEEERQAILETAATGEKIAVSALRWLKPGNWETICVEQEFVAPLAGTGGFKFIVDWIARDRLTGSVWVFDHKTRSKMRDEDPAQLLQLPLYQHALGAIGVKVDGTACFQILSRLPEIPRLTQKGAMSRQAITTDWETYRQALLDAGLDPVDYADMRARLNTPFFRVQRQFRAPSVAERIWSEVLLPVAERIEKGLTRLIPHRSGGCAFCAYAPLCDAHMAGDDEAWVREAYYTVGKPRVTPTLV